MARTAQGQAWGHRWSAKKTLFCKKSPHSLYSQGVPHFQSTSSIIWDAKLSQCILCYLLSCRSSTLQAWRKGSPGKSIRNILISLFSILCESRNPTLFPQMSSGMSCSIWALSTGRDENQEGKEWGSPRHLICVLHQKSEKQCKKVLQSRILCQRSNERLTSYCPHLLHMISIICSA